MEVGGQLHCPATLSPAKSPPLDRRMMGPRAGLYAVAKTRRFLMLPGMNASSSSP